MVIVEPVVTPPIGVLVPGMDHHVVREVIICVALIVVVQITILMHVRKNGLDSILVTRNIDGFS